MAGLGQDSTTVWNARDPGTYAWNHSVAAALALALCGLYEPDPVLRGSLLDFGMLRLQKFFEHGINDWGIPYEGFSYCGVSLRVIGLFGLLIAREPQRMKAYQGLRGAYSGKLARLLEWIDGATFPSGKFLISYNQSEYSASLAVAGLLLFFGDSDPDKAVFLWSKLAGDSVDGLHGDTTDLARSCAFEAMFFISKPVPEDCPFTRTSAVDLSDGWALLQSGQGLRASKIFVKSSTFLQGPHNHSDANHFTAILEGMPLFLDSGAAAKICACGRIVRGLEGYLSRGTQRCVILRAQRRNHRRQRPGAFR
jgi:hypothetical protein